MKTTATAVTVYIAFLASCLAAPTPLGTGAVAAVEGANAVVLEDRGAATKSGDITYYDVGMGSCGHDDSGKGDSENIVAVSPGVMGGGDDSACGRKVTIKGPNGEVTAIVRDKCVSCGNGSIDVSAKVFKDVVGDLGVGRSAVTWSFQ